MSAATTTASSDALRLPTGRLILGAAASLVTFVVLALTLDLSQLQTALDAAPHRPSTVALAALAYSAAFLLRAVAWQRLLSTRTRLADLFSILQTSLFLNHLLPVKAGEVARPYIVTQRGVPAAEAVSTTLVARLLDFAALALLALVALPAATQSGRIGLGFQLATVFIIAVAAGLIAVRALTPERLPLAIARRFASLQVSLREISARRVATAVPLVVASWLLESAVLLAGATLLGVDLTLREAVGATAFTILFQVVHLTPGGLGVYEASMTSVLVLQGVPAETALGLAVVTHGLKFAYSFSVGLTFAAFEAVRLLTDKRETDAPRAAARTEIVAARLWNVLNEGKPFTIVFSLGLIALLSLPRALDASFWPRAGLALLALTPLLVVFWRFDFPLRLRWALFVYLGIFVALFRFIDPVAVGLAVALYLTFTVVMWGTVYYHLRMGTRWTNCLRFWRLVLENPDPTSGNLQEQLPKCLLVVLAFQYVVRGASPVDYLQIEALIAAIGVSAVLIHQWFFTWVPALPQRGHNVDRPPESRRSRRVIAIVIDGCRADRLREAHTPFIDHLREIGTEYTNMAVAYPARTVTCFSSMLTGAPAKVHGMRSNFVPSLGVKCDSVFASLRRNGLVGRLVGIAHLVDAFGHADVRTVTAVMDNDAIDDALVARAKQVMEADDPDLLVLQLLSVDQTGHARGSYYDEYLHKIEESDRKIEAFLAWCDERGYLEDTTLLLTADHGQGIGIGGHGHMTPTEIYVPCILWGHDVEAGRSIDSPRFITDIAATICRQLGVEAPAESVGRSLLPATDDTAERPLVYIIPAFNEADSLPAVLDAVFAVSPTAKTVVVDDGSKDRTAEVAAAWRPKRSPLEVAGFTPRCAEAPGVVLVRHETNRGLGAALRTGLAVARDLDARAAVYLDADGEYDPADATRLLAPIEDGTADYVLGSRFKSRPEGMTFARRFANRCFSLLLSALAGHRISDGQTGFRAFSRRALDVAEIIHDYNYAQVLTLDLLHKGMRLTEVPISYRRRSSGRSYISAQYLWRVPLGMAREVIGE